MACHSLCFLVAPLLPRPENQADGPGHAVPADGGGFIVDERFCGTHGDGDADERDANGSDGHGQRIKRVA